MQSWQQGVERYVAGKHDPSALREVTLAGGRRGFAVLGEADPSHSTDANGVLLGHKAIDGRPWFIYLVGLVRKQKAEEIQLAAVSFAGDKPQWAISPKDSAATATYRHYNEGLWLAHPHAKKDKPPAEFTTFPREGDSFELTVQRTTIQATHSASGAKWTLDVAQPAKR
jgi:hypothetical protein